MKTDTQLNGMTNGSAGPATSQVGGWPDPVLGQLEEFSLKLFSLRTWEEIASWVVDQLPELMLPSEGICFFSVNPVTGRLKRMGERSPRSPHFRQECLPDLEKELDRVFEERDVVCLESDPPKGSKDHDSAPTRTLVAPVLFANTRLGLLCVQREGFQNPFTDDDLLLIRLAAWQLGIALNNSNAVEELERRLVSRSIVHEVAGIFSMALDSETMFNRLVGYVGDTLSARVCVLYTMEESAKRLTVQAWRGEKPEEEVAVPLGRGLVGSVAESGNPLFVRRAGRHELYQPEYECCPTDEAVILAPLISKGNVTGVLVAAAPAGPNQFQSSDLETLTLCAGQTAVSLDNVRLYKRLEVLATTDELTSLANRRCFQDSLSREVLRAKRYEHPLCLLILDIDHFKLVNDTYGHTVGDRVLRNLADAILSQVRRTDIVARFGGEEISVIMPYTRERDALMVSERIRRHIEETDLFGGTIGRTVTISIGVSSYPTDGQDDDSLIKSADDALYLAKGAGRNCVRTAGMAHG